MNLFLRLASAVLFTALAAGGVHAQADKAKQQDEVRKVTASSLQKFYKADPKLKAEVEKAPGYAVFTTYGLSFIVGGAGGKGVAYDNKTKRATYMDMAQVSAGIQVGASESETLIVFKSPKALQGFIDSGWEVGGSGSFQAGARGDTAGQAGGSSLVNEAVLYTLTKNGLQVGGAVTGTKFWKSKDLN